MNWQTLFAHRKVELGKEIFVLVSKSGMDRVKSVVFEGAEKTGGSVIYEIFNGDVPSLK